jgi:hypothetical protein
VNDERNELDARKDAVKRAAERLFDRIADAHARMKTGAPTTLLDEPLAIDAQGNVVRTNADENSNRYVMVQYEKPYMQAFAKMICRGHGDVLNVGFGCGLIDDAIQAEGVRSHTIVEAHVTVLEWMRARGWTDRAGVHVIASRWQDVAWSRYARAFDGILFDPFPFAGDADTDLWTEVVRSVVRPGGICGLYGPDVTAAEAERVAAAFRRPGVTVEMSSCVVDVPFVVPEWAAHGVGRHTVPVFGVRFP